MKRKPTPAKKPSAYKRTEAFLLDYTRGLSGEELRRLFDRDAKGAYSVLMRDRGTGAPLYEARASSDGNTAGGAEVLGAMYRAALFDFPRSGVNPRSVTVPLRPQ